MFHIYMVLWSICPDKCGMEWYLNLRMPPWLHKCCMYLWVCANSYLHQCCILVHYLMVYTLWEQILHWASYTWKTNYKATVSILLHSTVSRKVEVLTTYFDRATLLIQQSRYFLIILPIFAQTILWSCTIIISTYTEWVKTCSSCMYIIKKQK